MVYFEYHNFKSKYIEAQKRCDDILREKEVLFEKTQPKSSNLDSERVSGGASTNTFDEYLITKEEKKIDDRLSEAMSILKDRETLLKSKESELKTSKAWYDKIYVYYFIDGLSCRKIEVRTPFSKSEIYRIIKKMKNL